MVHRLPKAQLVQRIPYVAEQVRGRGVIHVGFVDAGYQEMQAEAGTWLHAHLAEAATSLSGSLTDAGEHLRGVPIIGDEVASPFDRASGASEAPSRH